MSGEIAKTKKKTMTDQHSSLSFVAVAMSQCHIFSDEVQLSIMPYSILSVVHYKEKRNAKHTHTHTHTHTTKVNSRRKLVPGSAAASCRVCVERHERSR